MTINSATIHRPRTAAEMQDAARQLIRDGHGDHDTAAILRLNVALVWRMIGHQVIGRPQCRAHGYAK
jgi:hypothetical protein